jgi:hypothetical protein
VIDVAPVDQHRPVTVRILVDFPDGERLSTATSLGSRRSEPQLFFLDPSQLRAIAGPALR